MNHNLALEQIECDIPERKGMVLHRRVDGIEVERILCFRVSRKYVEVTYNFPDGVREECIPAVQFNSRLAGWIASGFSIQP